VVTGGLTAQFTDASTRGPTSWLWDLGDGTTSTVQNPTHTYATGGTYNVSLTVSNVAGADAVVVPVTVQLAPPVASFTCTPVGGGVACDGSSSIGEVNYAWVAADAILITGQGTATPTFTFAASGTYSISLTVENASGTPDSITKNVTVTVPQPPGAPVVTVVSNVNGLVQLSATASNNPTGWSWSASGGTPATGSNSSFTTSYTTDGDKTIRLFAINAVGAGPSTATTVRVNVSNPPVITSIRETSNSNGTVSLSATATNSPTSWTWTLLDGGTTQAGGSTATPTFAFTTNGTYRARAVARNADGPSAQSTYTITVNDGPNANFTYDDQGTQTVAFTDTSTNATGATYSWNFGDGRGSSTAATPVPYTYAVGATYSVQLTVTLGALSDSITLPVTVA
jgi:PKD repeat protein